MEKCMAQGVVAETRGFGLFCDWRVNCRMKIIFSRLLEDGHQHLSYTPAERGT